MSTEETSHPTMDERLAKARQREEQQRQYREQLERVALAEQEVPGAYAAGNVTKTKLAEVYGVSTNTISRILAQAGMPQRRIRHLTDEERKEVATRIAAGTTKEELAEAYGCSVNAIRKIGLDFGVLRKGERKPLRSDAEYEEIADVDRQLIQRFGSGLYNLGVGLRAFEKRQERKASGGRPIAPPTSGPTSESHPAATSAPAESPRGLPEGWSPQDEPAPAPVQAPEPAQLAPEDFPVQEPQQAPEPDPGTEPVEGDEEPNYRF